MAIPLSIARPSGPREGLVRVVFGGPTMGVDWWVLALAPVGFDTSGAQQAVQAALNTIVEQMSPWEAGSDISRFNQATAGSWMDLPAAFAHVLDRSLHWAEASGGAFDPALGRLVDLWGFGPPGAVTAPPADHLIAEALAQGGYDRLAREGRRIFQPGGLVLDFSGIAKGFGVDETCAVLGHLGLSDYLVEIGGELRGEGVALDGQPWWVEIAPPPGLALPGGPLRVALHGLSIATSGDYRRAFDHDGHHYGHTLDPRLGRPIINGVRSVSVLAPACIDADAICTALNVMGPTDGMAFAAARDIAAHMLVEREDGLTEFISPALAAMLD